MNRVLLALGEALIDFIPGQTGVPFDQVTQFSPKVGGAPANVCGAFSRLGGESRMITQLGDDPFGWKIHRELEAFGVDTRAIAHTRQANTALAFVSLDRDGDRTFSFYRNPSADMLYTPEQLEEDWFSDAFALHFCSVALSTPSMVAAHRRAIDLARASGAIISFDPNLRLPLWSDPAQLRQVVHQFLPLADVVKISHEELEFLTGTSDIEQALDKLFVGAVQLVLYTCGGGETRAFTKTARGMRLAQKVQAVDTTGAGDGFIGSFLHSLYRLGQTPETLGQLTGEQLEELIGFSNRFCALSVQRPGAIASYPDGAEMGLLPREGR